MTCILLATDGSENSSRATDFAVQLAKSMGLAMWIVNITDHMLSATELAEFSRAEHATRSEITESISTQMLEVIKQRVEQAPGGPEVHVAMRKGDVAREIMEIADEKDAAAIVVGKRGRGTLAGLLIGSVAQKLVSLSARTVIVVP